MRNHLSKTFIFIFLLILPTLSLADQLRVVRATDGDTIKAAVDGMQINLNHPLSCLSGILSGIVLTKTEARSSDAGSFSAMLAQLNFAEQTHQRWDSTGACPVKYIEDVKRSEFNRGMVLLQP